LNLSVLLEDSARKYPDRDALVLGPTRLSYAQVNAAANQVANLLVERGVQPGDKVALSCPNLPWFPIVYYGILKAARSWSRSTSCSKAGRLLDDRRGGRASRAAPAAAPAVACGLGRAAGSGRRVGVGGAASR
jgi:non-ribosomal peptide synthetase component F